MIATVTGAARWWYRRRTASHLLSVLAAVLAAVVLTSVVIDPAIAMVAVGGGVTLGMLVLGLGNARSTVRAVCASLVIVSGGAIGLLVIETATVIGSGVLNGILGTTILWAPLLVGLASVLTLAPRATLGVLAYRSRQLALPLAGAVLVVTAVVILQTEGTATLGAVFRSVLGSLTAHALGRNDAFALYTLPLLLGLACLSVIGLTRAVPLDVLAGRGGGWRRGVDRLERSERTLGITGVGGILVAVGLLFVARVLVVHGPLEGLHTDEVLVALPALPARILELLVTATGPRIVLVSVLSSAVVIGLASWTSGRVRRWSADRAVLVLAPIVGSILTVFGLAALVAILGGPDVVLPDGAPASLTESIGGLHQAGFAAVGYLVATIVSMGVVVGVALIGALTLPYADEGPALAAAALFALSLSILALGVESLAFAAAATAIVVWDAGVYGRTIDDGLRPGARTVRAELTHLGGTVAIATAAAVGAAFLWAGLAHWPNDAPPAISLGILLLAGIGTLLLLRRL